MRFLALIYGEESARENLPADARDEVYEAYARFAEDGRRAGVVIGGDELGAVRSATTVRVRDGQTEIADGPYAETREVLGGYFVLRCDSFDEALEWAATIPAAHHGAVEVRPVHEDESGAAAAETAREREGVAS